MKGDSMPLSALAVLSPEQREKLAGDHSFGGGSLLRAAVAANPHPTEPFLRSGRPLINTDGRPQTDFSLVQLQRLAESWSVWYLERGVRPRDRVAIYRDDSFAYSVQYYALSQIGAIAVLVNSWAPPSIALSLCEQTNPVGILTDEARLAALGERLHALPGLRWTQTVEDLPAPPAADLPESARFRHAPADPVSILHSSGTTGRPKPAIQTHESSVAGPRFRLVTHKETPGALTMTALPQSHLGCIAYMSYAVLGGTPVVPLYDASGRQLEAAVTEHRPTAVMAFGHAYAELAALDPPPGALDSVSSWVSIGDAVHEAHIKKVLAQRSDDLPPAAFLDRLGTTELGWGVLLQVRTLATERKDRCAGKPVGVAEVAVLRPDGTHAEVNEFGLLGAKGPAITAGYWNDSDTTYRTRLSGFWLTGDVAYGDEEGNYYQVDRAVDAIETPSGTGYSVFMEELILNEVPEIADCTVIAGRDGDRAMPVAVVRLKADDADPAALLAAANEALYSARHPQLALLEVARSDEDFPVGVTGKVLKRQLREKYGSLPGYLGNGKGKVLASAPWLSTVASSAEGSDG
jgi:acyl-coenzyme A synthetase/AMP-(fatty) acid ligase